MALNWGFYDFDPHFTQFCPLLGSIGKTISEKAYNVENNWTKIYIIYIYFNSKLENYTLKLCENGKNRLFRLFQYLNIFVAQNLAKGTPNELHLCNDIRPISGKILVPYWPIKLIDFSNSKISRDTWPNFIIFVWYKCLTWMHWMCY